MALQAITFGANLPGYEIGDKSLPAIIVLQEWWGITDIVKKQAELVAAQGPYRVLVPDLYKGKIGVTAEEAAHLFNHLDFHAAVAEIGQALKYLKETGSPKVGITGFCMGGALTLASAAKLDGLSAAVANYGIPPTTPGAFPEVFNIKIPVVGIFGEKDKHKGFSDAETARAFAAKLKESGVDFQLEVYATGVHGFFNQLIKPEGQDLVQREQGDVTSEEDLQTAWKVLLGHFAKHLK